MVLGWCLDRYRDLHGISHKEHKELLKEYEWREEEFEAGFQKGVAPRDGSKHFLAYEALVRRELAKGEVSLGLRPCQGRERYRSGKRPMPNSKYLVSYIANYISLRPPSVGGVLVCFSCPRQVRGFRARTLVTRSEWVCEGEAGAAVLSAQV